MDTRLIADFVPSVASCGSQQVDPPSFFSEDRLFTSILLLYGIGILMIMELLGCGKGLETADTFSKKKRNKIWISNFVACGLIYYFYCVLTYLRRVLRRAYHVPSSSYLPPS